MKISIVYDSFFGNTERLAKAIGSSFGREADVAVTKAAETAPPALVGTSLLIVGSPTRGFRPSEATSRFLASIPEGALTGIVVAAFDTRVALDRIPQPLRLLARIFGYAAAPMAARLRKKGGILAAPPEGFFVSASEGPLVEGEEERAAAWARKIANRRE